MCRRRVALGLALFFLMFLTACKGSSSIQKAPEEIQQFYSGVSRIDTTYVVQTDYQDRVSEFTLKYQKSPDMAAGTVTVEAPEEIAGVGASIGEDGLVLSYDGASLEVPVPELNGFTPVEAVPSVMHTLAGSLPVDAVKETVDEIDCVALTYEMNEGRASVLKRVWFDLNSLFPVKAEVYLDGTCVFSISFLTFDAS